MIRAQIYLTENEQRGLLALSQQTGNSRSELVRKAIDYLISSSEKPDKKAMLQSARGLWSARKDLPDFKIVRKEFDRIKPRKKENDE